MPIPLANVYCEFSFLFENLLLSDTLSCCVEIRTGKMNIEIFEIFDVDQKAYKM